MNYKIHLTKFAVSFIVAIDQGPPFISGPSFNRNSPSYSNK